MYATPRLLRGRSRATFDVICAGEPLWKLAPVPGGLTRTCGPVEVGIMATACQLTRAGIRVGLAIALTDDTLGRRSLQAIAAAGIDVDGVTLVSPSASFVVVDAAGGQSGSLEDTGSRTFAVPRRWSSRVLLLSGLSPITSIAAAFCRAARQARRASGTVVLDLAVNLRIWAGRDPRTIAMVLREADVVRARFEDLAILGMDVRGLRQTMRPNATLVMVDDRGARALGAFGEITSGVTTRVSGAETTDACVVAICAELARPSDRAESEEARWHRVLERWCEGMSRVKRDT